MVVLVINCGSSSVKFALFSGDRTAARGMVERIGSHDASGHLDLPGSSRIALPVPSGADHASALGSVLAALRAHPDLASLEITAIGHRVVHGGDRFSSPTLITPQVLAEIRDLAPLAPSHALANATGIDAATRVFPGVPQVAVFDTAFHQSIPPEVYHYALPPEFHREHRVRRYGFHGTSHAWVAARAVETLGLPEDKHRLLTAHLGNGCSATAILDGKSVDTTMGLTPLEGLVMGTRSGNVDPNLHSYLHRRTGMSLDEITDLLNHRSGLTGVAGVNDMRHLAELHAQGDPTACLAIDLFTFRLARELCGLCAALGGRPDAIVFTGGIGENSPLIRAETIARLSVLSTTLDPVLNAVHGRDSRGRISPEITTPVVLVIPTNEELAIATETRRLTTVP
jgi:acetate kinase